MKRSKHLDGYLLEANGNVIEENTGMIVEPIETNEYKVLTTETFYSTLKKRDVQLWRRFSKEQLVKMYEQGTDMEVTKPSKILTNTQVEESVQVVQVASVQVDDNVQVGQGKSVQVSINGVVYKSVNDASKELSMHRNTIKKRLDDESNKAYYYV